MLSKELSKKYIEKLIIKTHALLTNNEGNLLYDLAKKCKGDIVEIGSYKGGSTIILAKGLKDPFKVYAVDYHKYGEMFLSKDFNLKVGKENIPMNTLNIFLKNIKESSVSKKIVPIVNKSENVVRDWNKKIDILWIDGDHDYVPVKRDYILWEKHLKIGGIIIFHDSTLNKCIFPVTGKKSHFIEGPYRIINEFIIPSKRFKEIKEVDTITYAIKVKNRNLIEKVRLSLYLLEKNNPSRQNKIFYNNLMKIDKFIGILSKKIKRIIK